MESYLYFGVDTDKLIQSIHKRRALWDRGDLDYLNINIRIKLWGEVAQELNTTRYAVRGKWEALRVGFMRRLKKMPVRPSGDAGLEFSDYTSWPHFKSLYFLKDQFKPNSRTGGILPEEKNALRDNQTDRRHGELESSGYNGSREELNPSAKVVNKRSGGDGPECSVYLSSPECKRLCLQEDQFASHARSSDIPPDKKKTLKDDRRDTRDGELKTSQYRPSEKELKPCVKVLRRRPRDSPQCSSHSILPECKRPCSQKDQFTSHASSGDFSPEKRAL
jgi:hypothetical protein